MSCGSVPIRYVDLLDMVWDILRSWSKSRLRENTATLIIDNPRHKRHRVSYARGTRTYSK